MVFAEEWPLMLFTFLSQFAVGTFTILFVLRMIIKDKELNKKFTLTGIRLVVPVMALALILSLFHLGTPTGAYRSIFNLDSSWLSREILTAGGFFVLAAVSLVVYKDAFKSNTLGIVTAVVGLAAVFCMASIYYTSIMPAWMTLNTYLIFFGTTLTLGSLGAITSLTLSLKGSRLTEETGKALKKIVIVGLAALVIPLIYTPVFVSSLNGGEAAAQASAQLFTGSYMLPVIIRWVLSLAGIGLLFATLNKRLKSVPVGNAVFISLALVLIGEFIGRYVFYATAVSSIIGG